MTVKDERVGRTLRGSATAPVSASSVRVDKKVEDADVSFSPPKRRATFTDKVVAKLLPRTRTTSPSPSPLRPDTDTLELPAHRLDLLNTILQDLMECKTEVKSLKQNPVLDTWRRTEVRSAEVRIGILEEQLRHCNSAVANFKERMKAYDEDGRKSKLRKAAGKAMNDAVQHLECLNSKSLNEQLDDIRSCIERGQPSEGASRNGSKHRGVFRAKL